MAARSPRRTFSNPFVVTLAAIPACVSSNPPPPTTTKPEPVQVAPAPIAEPTAGTQPATPPAAPPVVVANPPRPVDPPAPEPATPAPTPVTYDQHWRVTKSGAGCLAMPEVKCPTAAPGKPMPTCNPPPPIKYACPDSFTDGQPMNIVLRAGETECKVDFGPMKCPPKAMCNPPRPQIVACPKR